jgi:hypothetical protein
MRPSVRLPDHWAVRPSVHRPSDHQTIDPSGHKLVGTSDQLTIYSSDLQVIGPTFSQTTIPSNGQPLSYLLPHVTNPPHLSIPDSLPTNDKSKYLFQNLCNWPNFQVHFLWHETCWVMKICCEIQYMSLFLLSGFPKPSLPFVIFILHAFMSAFIVHSFYMHSLLWHVYIWPAK